MRIRATVTHQASFVSWQSSLLRHLAAHVRETEISILRLLQVLHQQHCPFDSCMLLCLKSVPFASCRLGVSYGAREYPTTEPYTQTPAAISKGLDSFSHIHLLVSLPHKRHANHQ